MYWRLSFFSVTVLLYFFIVLGYSHVYINPLHNVMDSMHLMEPETTLGCSEAYLSAVAATIQLSIQDNKTPITELGHWVIGAQTSKD